MAPRPKLPFRLLSSPSRQFIRHSSTLLPSVQVLLHTHSLSADSITPTGPKQNILKSDVLAAIGAIPASVPASQAERAAKLSHLDLSNIVIATQASAPPAEPPAPLPSKLEPPPPAAAEEPALLPLSVPISLAPLLSLQQKLSDTLGSAPSLSTLLARAVAVANTALPVPQSGPTADELFDALVSPPAHRPGRRVSDGKYVPMVANSSELIEEIEEEDVYDVLTLTQKPKHSIPSVPAEQPGAINMFALLVPPEEEKRALTFLERLRDVVEANPGRLIGL